MNKEELIKHCERQIELSLALGDMKHCQEHQLILKIIEENQKYKEVIDKAIKKCETKKGKYDFDVWSRLKYDWATLNDFAEHIKYNLHPIITLAYQSDIKNSIKDIIAVTQSDVILKQDILDILKEVK